MVWKGFTLDNWKNPCGAPQVCTAVANSLQIGIISTLFATILGTMIAFAIGRHKFRGRKTTNLLIFLPMADDKIAAVTAERLLMAIAELAIPELQIIHRQLTISIGLSLFGPNYDFIQQQQQADQALDRAKHLGRNRVEFAPQQT